MTVDGFLTVRHAHKIYIHPYTEDQIKAFIIGMISFKNKILKYILCLLMISLLCFGL